MDFTGVYKIEHVATGRVYVGSARLVLKRWHEHRRMLMAGVHDNDKLQRAWQLHGPESFLFSLLEAGISTEALRDVEQTYMDHLDAFCSGFNMRPAANDQTGFRHSEKSRNRMSERHRGVKLAPAHAENVRLANLSRPAEARRLSSIKRSASLVKAHAARAPADVARTSAKISAALTGRPVPPETREKISEKLAGRRLPDDHVRRLRAALGKLTDDQRASLVSGRLAGASFVSLGRQFGVSRSGARKIYLFETRV